MLFAHANQINEALITTTNNNNYPHLNSVHLRELRESERERERKSERASKQEGKKESNSVYLSVHRISCLRFAVAVARLPGQLCVFVS